MFDALTLVLAAAQLEAQPQDDKPETNWTFKEDTDPLTGQHNARSQIASSDGRRFLVFACNGINGPTLSIQYKTDQYIGSFDRPVFIKLDNGPIIPSPAWTPVSTTVYSVDQKLIEQFVGAIGRNDNRIVVRALDYENQPVDGVFLSHDGASAVARVVAVCQAQMKPKQ